MWLKRGMLCRRHHQTFLSGRKVCSLYCQRTLCIAQQVVLFWWVPQRYLKIWATLTHTQDVQAAFGDLVTLTVIGVSGLFLVTLFFLALTFWRLSERADKMRELKNLYQDSMRAARDGIELLLKTGSHPLSLCWHCSRKSSHSQPCLRSRGRSYFNGRIKQ